MKESLRQNFLSFIAVTAIILFLIPVVFLLRALLFGSSGGFLHVALYFAASFFGYFAGRIIFREDSAFFERASRHPAFKLFFYLFNVKEKGRLLSNIGGFVSLLVPAITATALFAGYGALRLVFEFVFLVLPYLITLKNSGKTYSDVLYNQVVFFGFFVMAAAIIAANYVEGAGHLKWYFYAVLYVYIDRKSVV